VVPLGHTWSLAVEEHFYLALPLVLLALAKVRKDFRLVPAVSIVVSVLCLYLRSQQPLSVWANILFPTHLRIDALMAGVALGYFSRFDRERFVAFGRSPLVLLAGVVVVSMGWVPAPIIGLTFFYLGFSLIVIWAAGRPQSKNPAIRALALLGKYSYSVYLWQQPFMLEYGERERSAGWWLLTVSAIVATGVVMAKLVEFPVLRLRDRWLPSCASHVETEATSAGMLR